MLWNLLAKLGQTLPQLGISQGRDGRRESLLGGTNPAIQSIPGGNEKLRTGVADDHVRKRVPRAVDRKRAGQREIRGRGQFDLPGSGRLHEEVVRMLMVDQGLPVDGFPGLKEFPVALFPHGRRVEAQHLPGQVRRGSDAQSG